jgi:hypothetical protein
MQLNSRASQIIQKQIDPWTYQTPHLTAEQSFMKLKDQIDMGRLWCIEDRGVVMLFEMETKYLAQMHLFADGNVRYEDWTAAGLSILKHVFDKTEIKKIYGRFTNRKILSLALRGGFKREGVLSKAHMIQSGEMIDYYIAGITKDELYSRWKRYKK